MFSVAVTVTCSIVLVKYLGMIGAAYTYVLATLTMAGIMYFICQKFYYVKYDWGKILAIIFLFIGSWVLNDQFIVHLPNISRITGQFILLLLFLVVAWMVSLKKIYFLLSFKSVK